MGPVIAALREMAEPMRDLPRYVLSVGVDRGLIDRLAMTIANIASQLEKL